MTIPGNDKPEPAERLASAADDLAELRHDIEAASRGDVGPDVLRRRLTDYLSAHGPALQAAATEVAEETRRQALEQLYALRAQLRTIRQSAAAERRQGET